MFPVVHFSFSCTNGFQGPYKSVLKRVSWWKNHSSMQSKNPGENPPRPPPQHPRSTMSYCRLFTNNMNGLIFLSLNYLLLQGKYFGPNSGISFEIWFGLHRGCGKYLRKKDNSLTLPSAFTLWSLWATCIPHTPPTQPPCYSTRYCSMGIKTAKSTSKSIWGDNRKKNKIFFSKSSRRFNYYFWILTFISGCI